MPVEIDSTEQTLSKKAQGRQSGKRTPKQCLETSVPKPATPCKRFRVNIYDAWCKKCGICVEVCPKGVLVSDELGTPHAVYQEKCVGCTQCVLHCPDFAIALSELDAEGQDK